MINLSDIITEAIYLPTYLPIQAQKEVYCYLPTYRPLA